MSLICLMVQCLSDGSTSHICLGVPCLLFTVESVWGVCVSYLSEGFHVSYLSEVFHISYLSEGFSVPCLLSVWRFHVSHLSEGSMSLICLKVPHLLSVWRFHISYLSEGSISLICLKVPYHLSIWRFPVSYLFEGSISLIYLKVPYLLSVWRFHISYLSEGSLSLTGLNGPTVRCLPVSLQPPSPQIGHVSIIHLYVLDVLKEVWLQVRIPKTWQAQEFVVVWESQDQGLQNCQELMSNRLKTKAQCYQNKPLIH